MQLISREEIKTLIEEPKGNCVSIYMPTHPGGPEVRQDPIRFKNLVKEAETRLTVYLHPEKEAGDEDLLDFVAAHTLLNGGTVYAVPFEEIPYSTAVAAIYRY